MGGIRQEVEMREGDEELHNNVCHYQPTAIACHAHAAPKPCLPARLGLSLSCTSLQQVLPKVVWKAVKCMCSGRENCLSNMACSRAMAQHNSSKSNAPEVLLMYGGGGGRHRNNATARGRNATGTHKTCPPHQTHVTSGTS